jgi:hypothetical protein
MTWRLPTIPVGNLRAQPVDKRMRALWHKPVKRIGENIAKLFPSTVAVKNSPPLAKSA